ncbi:hypothetical protein K4A83_07395 [Spirulina subsalsa FACHB-351]|uniref:Uncharacterized protein n=1 Tax=Spirulina subsalsa FACHB-351 TaxID=234711 RepID=A0ABT3L3L6_9CYAN|nr:hypothetical protein [Spirulina subsalsa]MCW6036095.1 hypothetical protein [Spirulina subsalsa FACHB-351]
MIYVFVVAAIIEGNNLIVGGATMSLVISGNIVSNTSPILNLATVGNLNLLQEIYGTILIPCAVREELLDERAGQTVITAVQSATWLEVHSVQNQQLVAELIPRVNIGEAEAIPLKQILESVAKCRYFE